MSNHSEGDRWRRASDGKWYRPDPTPSPPPRQLVAPPPSRKGEAIAALWCGGAAVVLAIFPFTFVIAWIPGGVAFVLGLVALRDPTQRKLAIRGTVLGIIWIPLSVLGMFIYAPFVPTGSYSYPDCAKLVDGEAVPSEFVTDSGYINLQCSDGGPFGSGLSRQVQCQQSDREIASTRDGYTFTDDMIFHLGDGPKRADC